MVTFCCSPPVLWWSVGFEVNPLPSCVDLVWLSDSRRGRHQSRQVGFGQHTLDRSVVTLDGKQSHCLDGMDCRQLRCLPVKPTQRHFCALFGVASPSPFTLSCPRVLKSLVRLFSRNRFHQAAGAMRGSAHETFLFFSGGHLRSLSFLMMALAAVTVGLMAIQLLASVELSS